MATGGDRSWVPTNGLPSGAASYQVRRHGALVMRARPDVVLHPELPAPAPVAMEHVRGVPTGTALLAARAAANGLLVPRGLRRDQVEVTAHWTGGLPDPGSPGQTAVVTVTLPRGAVVVTAEWLEPLDGGGLAGSDCGRAVLPAGTPATGRVYAAACDVTDSAAPMSSFLVVVAPREVRVVTADGVGLGRVELLGHAADLGD